jgi:hypothetical protein
MKYIFIPYIFNIINIHILHYKLSQTSNSLTEKSQSVRSLWNGGITCSRMLLTKKNIRDEGVSGRDGGSPRRRPEE